MRTTLGILSALFLVALVVGIAFSGMFASGWEGGRGRGPGWELFIGTAPLIYAVYCLLCATVTFSARLLLVTGIIAHALLAAFLVTLVVRRVHYPGASNPTAGIILASVFAALWFAHFRAVSRREAQR